MVKPVEFTYDEISRVLDYDPEAGEITWKVTLTSRAKAGDRAGVWQTMRNGKPYRSVTYRGRKMQGAQLAWFLFHKEWPDRSVYFRDDDTKNLKIANLKLADHKAERVVTEDGTVRYLMSTAQQRHYGLLRFYGLSVSEYMQKHTTQNGLCAICCKPETSKSSRGRYKTGSGDKIRDMSVDHDHETGRVRDLLCSSCNHMLGHAKDDPAILMAGAEYLIRHRDKKVE